VLETPPVGPVRWSAWGGPGSGLEHLDLVRRPGVTTASGVVVGATERGPFGLSYRLLVCDDWRLREAELATTAGRRLHLAADGLGRWHDGNGRSLPDLDGCIDIDIEVTPFTNTLPLRRLDLGPGESAVIRVAYVSLPSLALTTSHQRYTVLGSRHRYRFESIESGFTADLPVDDYGLVLDYPGLFRRLRPPIGH
jgi:hypothetical protein